MGAVVKDALEEKLRWLVVSGQIDLQSAQREIAEDWITAYRHYVGEFLAYVYDSLSH
jgi:hypothetical protein